jgi:hypothetical protein
MIEEEGSTAKESFSNFLWGYSNPPPMRGEEFGII